MFSCGAKSQSYVGTGASACTLWSYCIQYGRVRYRVWELNCHILPTYFILPNIFAVPPERVSGLDSMAYHLLDNVIPYNVGWVIV